MLGGDVSSRLTIEAVRPVRHKLKGSPRASSAMRPRSELLSQLTDLLSQAVPVSLLGCAVTIQQGLEAIYQAYDPDRHSLLTLLIGRQWSSTT